MVQYLIEESRKDESNDVAHWKRLARSIANELEYYHKQSRLMGRIAGRYRRYAKAYQEYATQLGDALSVRLKTCKICGGRRLSGIELDHCDGCSEEWELVSNVPHVDDIRKDDVGRSEERGVPSDLEGG